MASTNDDEQLKLDLERLKLRADYLLRNYGFYTSHMNQVFSFYLVAMGLIANAFVQALLKTSEMEPWGARSIAFGGALISMCFCMLHARSNVIAGLLDDELRRVEFVLGEIHFQRNRKGSRGAKNKHLFLALYFAFSVGFFAAGLELVTPSLAKPTEWILVAAFGVLTLVAWVCRPRPPANPEPRCDPMPNPPSSN